MNFHGYQYVKGTHIYSMVSGKQIICVNSRTTVKKKNSDLIKGFWEDMRKELICHYDNSHIIDVIKDYDDVYYQHKYGGIIVYYNKKSDFKSMKTIFKLIGAKVIFS